MATLALCACAGNLPRVELAAVAPAELTDGRILFGSTVPAAAMGSERILALSPAMARFIDEHVPTSSSDSIRLRRLLQAMIDAGYLDLEYEDEITQTASETFSSRIGNCLSFTNLFVALARQAGLDVKYQLVDIPPVWARQGDWVVLDKHINVVVRNVRIDARFRRDFVVDFNITDYQGNYAQTAISDDDAYALYFSNRGAEFMQAGDTREAFAHLKRAIELAETVSAPWINLGALYARNGHPAQADAAYRHALTLDSKNMSALANLARLHRGLGNDEMAAALERRIAHYRQSNPYFHYHRSLQAYREADYEQAQAALHTALRLKPEEHQFHFLRALIAMQTDRPQAVLRSLQRAHEHAGSDKTRERYERKLEALGGE